MGLERQRQMGGAYRWKCIVRAYVCVLCTHICATDLPILSQSSWCMMCSVWNIASLQFYHCALTRKWKPLWICQLSLWSRWWCWSGILVSEWVRAVCCALLVPLQAYYKWLPTTNSMHSGGACPHKVCLLELSWRFSKLVYAYITYIFVGGHKCCNPAQCMVHSLAHWCMCGLVLWHCPDVPVLTSCTYIRVLLEIDSHMYVLSQWTLLSHVAIVAIDR